VVGKVLWAVSLALLFGASAARAATNPGNLTAPPSLKAVPVPEPAALMNFVKDRKAAINLGKALFWDMQVGSDGVQACASCHFHAGADHRTKNNVNPGQAGNDKRDRCPCGQCRIQLTARLCPQQPGADPEPVPDREPSHVGLLENKSVPVAGGSWCAAPDRAGKVVHDSGSFVFRRAGQRDPWGRLQRLLHRQHLQPAHRENHDADEPQPAKIGFPEKPRPGRGTGSRIHHDTPPDHARRRHCRLGGRRFVPTFPPIQFLQ